MRILFNPDPEGAAPEGQPAPQERQSPPYSEFSVGAEEFFDDLRDPQPQEREEEEQKEAPAPPPAEKFVSKVLGNREIDLSDIPEGKRAAIRELLERQDETARGFQAGHDRWMDFQTRATRQEPQQQAQQPRQQPQAPPPPPQITQEQLDAAYDSAFDADTGLVSVAGLKKARQLEAQFHRQQAEAVYNQAIVQYDGYLRQKGALLDEPTRRELQQAQYDRHLKVQGKKLADTYKLEGVDAYTLGEAYEVELTTLAAKQNGQLDAADYSLAALSVVEKARKANESIQTVDPSKSASPGANTGRKGAPASRSATNPGGTVTPKYTDLMRPGSAPTTPEAAADLVNELWRAGGGRR